MQRVSGQMDEQKYATDPRRGSQRPGWHWTVDGQQAEVAANQAQGLVCAWSLGSQSEFGPVAGNILKPLLGDE